MRIVTSLIMLTLLCVAAMPAVGQTKSYEQAMVGKFEFPWLPQMYNNCLVVWPKGDAADSLGESTFGGVLTDKSVIKVVNRKIDRVNLDLLTGERVIAWGKFRTIGEGEGSETFCDTLNLVLLSKGTIGSVGRLEYRPGNPIRGPEIRVGLGDDMITGVINEKTTIDITGRLVKPEDIDLLDGEWVAVWGVVYPEVFKNFKELHIRVLPR